MNETTPKISVIVPVYKAEAYLHRCVDSILAQTFQDFEVLLIDDGSPDRSGEICDEYARKDRRVRVFHKENGGVSSARQCGMDNAQGEYTIHADPDDWVEPDMLEELYRKAKEEDADMVICDYYTEEKGRTKYIVQNPSDLNHETVLCELFQQLHGSCWNKLVRRACYKEFEVKFPEELSYCEDLFINTCLLSHSMVVVYLPKAFYHYDQYSNGESLVRRDLNLILLQEQTLYRLVKEKISKTLFDAIKLQMLFSQAYKVIYIGVPYLVTFNSDYKELWPSISHLNMPFKQKVLFWIAFKVSPQMAHSIVMFYSKIRYFFR